MDGNDSSRARFVGAWQLATETGYRPDGTVFHPRGEHPHGLLIYQASGHMAVQLMSRDHKELANNLETALGGFLAYYGTYTVDEAAQKVTHRLKGCSFASWENTDLVRAFVFEGQRLTLTAISPRADERERVLVWERVSEIKA